MEKEMESKDFSVLIVKKVFKIQDKKIVYIPKSGTTTSGGNKRLHNLQKHIKKVFPLLRAT